jgi:hypothetical protein
MHKTCQVINIDTNDFTVFPLFSPKPLLMICIIQTFRNVLSLTYLDAGLLA